MIYILALFVIKWLMGSWIFCPYSSWLFTVVASVKEVQRVNCILLTKYSLWSGLLSGLANPVGICKSSDAGGPGPIYWRLTWNSFLKTFQLCYGKLWMVEGGCEFEMNVPFINLPPTLLISFRNLQSFNYVLELNKCCWGFFFDKLSQIWGPKMNSNSFSQNKFA